MFVASTLVQKEGLHAPSLSLCPCAEPFRVLTFDLAIENGSLIPVVPPSRLTARAGLFLEFTLLPCAFVPLKASIFWSPPALPDGRWLAWHAGFSIMLLLPLGGFVSKRPS
jgi:hypothetical protein